MLNLLFYNENGDIIQIFIYLRKQFPEWRIFVPFFAFCVVFFALRTCFLLFLGDLCFKSVSHSAILLKKEHPRWGAGLIVAKLGEAFFDAQLPSESTILTWFKESKLKKKEVEHL